MPHPEDVMTAKGATAKRAATRQPEPSSREQVAALLLTGGASTRMGRDKATLEIDGKTMAALVADALLQVAELVLVVGHDAGTGLPTVEDPHEGPLVAVEHGAQAIQQRGLAPNTVVLIASCDLPYINPATLQALATALQAAAPQTDAVIPTFEDRDQPLCAAYLLGPLAHASRTLTATGERSMRALLSVLAIEHLGGQSLPGGEQALQDVDTREDLLALTGRGPLSEPSPEGA